MGPPLGHSPRVPNGRLICHGPGRDVGPALHLTFRPRPDIMYQMLELYKLVHIVE